MIIETINESVQRSRELDEHNSNSTNDEHEHEHEHEHTPATTNDSAPVSINIKSIPQKKICELTDDEKKALYEASLHNEYNDFYDVKRHANGNYRIVKRKPKTLAQQAIHSKGELTVSTDMQDKSKQSKVYMSDNQLVWMHLLDLEQKYERLYNKHKKLKRKYNDLYIEDVDEQVYSQPRQEPIEHEHETPSTCSTSSRLRLQETPKALHEVEEEPIAQTNLQANPYQPLSWRSMLIRRNGF